MPRMTWLINCMHYEKSWMQSGKTLSGELSSFVYCSMAHCMHKTGYYHLWLTLPTYAATISILAQIEGAAWYKDYEYLHILNSFLPQNSFVEIGINISNSITCFMVIVIFVVCANCVQVMHAT